MHPLILTAAILPLLGASILWIWFSHAFHSLGLKPLAQGFGKSAEAGAKIEGCSMENATVLEDALGHVPSPIIMESWKRVREDISGRYRHSALPEAESYFPYKSIIGLSGGRKYIPVVWGVFGLLCLVALLLPYLASLFIEGQLGMALILSRLCLTLLSLGQGIFLLWDQRVYSKAERAYYNFVAQFNRVLPVADSLAGPAMLLEATEKNQKAFLDAADRIEHAFFSFSHATILPALRDTSTLLIQETLMPAVDRMDTSLKDAMEAFSRQQDTTMKFMVDTFLGRMSKALEEIIVTFGRQLETTGRGLEKIDKQLAENLAAMGAMTGEQKAVLQQAGELSLKTGEVQEGIRTAQEEFTRQIQSLTGTLVGFEQTSADHTGKATGIMEEVKSVQQAVALQLSQAESQLSGSVNTLKDQYMDLSRMVQDMMEDITGRLHAATLEAGREMGRGFAEVTEENSRAIADLTALSAGLKQDYDAYFNRVENNTKQTLDDMDYHMQNIIAAAMGDIRTMIKENTEQNSAVLEQYKDSTADLLENFTEQSRSMSLYAKEMNYDITELSASMKDSVADFTVRIQEGINLAMNGLDGGLAELSKRIANTVESISDAVESLPKALGRDE